MMLQLPAALRLPPLSWLIHLEKPLLRASVTDVQLASAHLWAPR